MLGEIGSFLIALGFSAAMMSAFSYVRSVRRPSEALVNIGRAGFYVTVFSLMFAGAILMYLILNHQFQYHYVWAHSSTNLARPFLVASFYSGQEGSFMLWALLTAFIGVFVIGYAQKYRYEGEVMAMFAGVIGLLLLILVVDSPFETIFAAFPDQQFPAGFVPEDGRGLNPQLENLWITIHPPILFTGFAAMTVPFVFAMAGLLRRDYQNWISVALPWTLFASMVLGFGIMLGGWWAYETLGWGGYWAWDPVENSSLIPWLICVALVHTMVVQKRTGQSGSENTPPKLGGLARTNIFLAVCAYSGILYSTFLTRSGVLEDTSVHSFVTPGNFVYGVLLTVLLAFFVAGTAGLALRWRELKREALELKTMSRENWLGVGSALLLASAFIVLVGTSWPILMPLLGNPKAKIDTSFYNNTHIWIAIGIVLINAISVTLQWKNTPSDRFRKNLMISVPAALVATALVSLFGGVADPPFMVLMFGALLALIVNAIEGYRYARRNWRMAGAFVAHVGVALLVIGVIFTSRYSVTEHVQLAEGETEQVFGYDVTYRGQERIEQHKADREKYQHIVALEKNGSQTIVKPVIFWSDFNDREQPFLEPGIVYTPTGDLYVSPKSLETVGGPPTLVFSKGDRMTVPQDSTIAIRFERFDMSRAETERVQGAVLRINTPDTSMYVTPVRQLDGRYGMTAVPGTDLSVGFAELIVDREELAQSKARIRISSASVEAPPEKRAVTLDISIKPFIGLVWGGVIVMVFGFGVSIVRRVRELAQREKVAARELKTEASSEGLPGSTPAPEEGNIG